MDDESSDSTPWETSIVNKKRPAACGQDPSQIHANKRKSSDSALPTPVPVSNTFSILSDITEHEEQPTEKVPPIYLSGVLNSKVLLKSLQEKGGSDSFTLKSTSNKVVIYSKTPEKFRIFVRYLEETNAEFHTFQLPSDKKPKIVIRGLHFSTSQEDITTALADQGYTATSVTNVLSRRIVKTDENDRQSVTRNPLPLFFVDISPDTFNDKIYDIKYLLAYKISIEEPYKKRSLPQCTRCQSYSHTKSYCRHPYRCVRCGQDHQSGACQKSINTPATCANCKGPHPANYKGCLAYQKLRTQRQQQNVAYGGPQQTTPPPLLNQTSYPTLPTRNGNTHATVTRNINTYSQAASTDIPHLKTQQRNRIETDEHQYQQNRSNEFRNINTYSQAASTNTSRLRVQQQNTIETDEHQNTAVRGESFRWGPSDYHNHPSNDMVSFISDFNKIIQPLFNLLTQLTQFTQTFMLKYGH